MLVCWRDERFLRQLWYLCFRTLIGGHPVDLPGPGFVGGAYTSSLLTDQRRWRLMRVRLRRLRLNRSICDVRLWRLTCVWAPSRRHRPKHPSGHGSEHAGSSWEADGVGTSDELLGSL